MSPSDLPGRVDRVRLQAAKAWSYGGTPGLLLRKLAQAWRRRRTLRSYRKRLAGGAFLTTVEAPAGDRLFTVAMPVWRVSETHLRAAIASVTAQSYGRWELIALDDDSPDLHVGRVLAECRSSDSRIRVLSHRTNVGIARASNEILEHARGEYVAFLDHDDLIHPRALELVDRELARRPESDWLFTDEDKIDEDGRHSEPALKPGWSRHLLLTFNYVSHLRVVRRAVLERVGGHRTGFDGAQDYDLALRVLAAGGRFAHLPGVLYHWRKVRASMATAAVAKPAAHERALRALLEHAARFPEGAPPTGRVFLSGPSFFEVRRPCPRETAVAIVDCAADAEAWSCALRRPVEIHPSPAASCAEALVAAAHRASAPFLVVAPPGGFSAGDADELLALLMVPGTALAAGRWLAQRRVVMSGWVATSERTLWDPWRGLPAREPGYLNLALVPGPRLVPPPLGIVVRRDAVIAAWDSAPEADPAWRLPAGWARLGLEIVTTPRVAFSDVAARAEVPPGPPPKAAAAVQLPWLRELGLAAEESR